MKPESLDQWTQLFRKLDELLLLTPEMDAIWPVEQRGDFLLFIKGPCHEEAYQMGLTTSRPVCALGAGDLVEGEEQTDPPIRAISREGSLLH